MLNALWLGLILVATLLGGFLGKMDGVVTGAVSGAETAVNVAIGLIGIMAFWLGLMRLAEKAGLVEQVARFLQPLLRRLFPEVPAGHPAMGSMVMNIAANMLGLLNAATPLGLRAMRDLETLNPHPGTATNAMCTFLAINTSSIQLIPLTAIGILAVNHSVNPSAIIGTAFLATLFSTAAGITAVKWLEGLRWFAPPKRPVAADNPFSPAPAEPELSDEPDTTVVSSAPLSWVRRGVLATFFLCFLSFFLLLTFQSPAETVAALPSSGAGETTSLSSTNPLVATPAPPPAAEGGAAVIGTQQLRRSVLGRTVHALSLLAIPFLAALFPLYAMLRGLPVYEVFVEGAKEGFQIAVRIIPYLVAMLVAIGMFRGGGGIELLTRWLRPVLDLIGFPAELLPMALVRPLSGSASIAMLADIAQQFGGDHLFSRIAGTILGSTETTFYVVAVYFGAVNVRRTRHAVPAGLFADVVGVLASVMICRLVFT